MYIKKVVLIEKYNSDWIKDFTDLKSELDKGLFGLNYDIEHIGSTSVKNLDSKPIIDIDIYIDSQTGHRFEEIKPNTDIYRILNFYDYQEVLEEFSDKVNSTEAVKKINYNYKF